MKDIWSMPDKYFQHEFGCGVRVRFERVEFSDGLKIWIPREADNSVHDCPKLPNNDLHEVLAEVYTPEDPDDYERDTPSRRMQYKSAPLPEVSAAGGGGGGATDNRCPGSY